MQKLIRTSAIVAVALKAVATTLIILSFLLQPMLFDLFYSSVSMDGGSAFPAVPFIQSLLSLGCTIPLIFCCGKKKGGIVLEAVMFGILAVVLPAANTLSSFLFSNVITRIFSGAQMVTYSAANSIASWFAIPGNWGSAVAYAACGMSIVYKLMNKKQKSVLVDN